MMEGDRRLDQTLIEAAIGGVAFMPETFPDFVSVKELATIKKNNTRQIARVVFRRGCH